MSSTFVNITHREIDALRLKILNPKPGGYLLELSTDNGEIHVQTIFLGRTRHYYNACFLGRVVGPEWRENIGMLVSGVLPISGIRGYNAFVTSIDSENLYSEEEF